LRLGAGGRRRPPEDFGPAVSQLTETVFGSILLFAPEIGRSPLSAAWGEIMSRKLLLVGASVLAILVAAGAAHAETFTFSNPGFFVFTVPVTGEYLIAISGASGGGYVTADLPGGSGASISGVVKLLAGDSLGLNVGAEGQYTGGESGRTGGAGGGGSSFAVGPDRPGDNVGEGIAGGGGGAGFMGAGGPGLTGPSGGAGGLTAERAELERTAAGAGASLWARTAAVALESPVETSAVTGAMAAEVIPEPAGYFRMAAPGAPRAATTATTAAGEAATAAEAAGPAFPGAAGAAATAAEAGAGVRISVKHLRISTCSLGRIPATVRSSSWKPPLGRQSPNPPPGR
jgi:hypothetical protein